MKITHLHAFNIYNAIRGMRNPMSSYDRMDTHFHNGEDQCIIGPKDMELAQRLIVAGPEHCKFLRQIFTTMDISAPRYWWSEMDTYKVGTAANSQSSMHKIRPLTKADFEADVMTNPTIEKHWEETIALLNELASQYHETKDIKYLREYKRLLPESFLQTRTWSANYAILRNIIHQRHNHRLTEWTYGFIPMLKLFPYADELLFYNNG